MNYYLLTIYVSHVPLPKLSTRTEGRWSASSECGEKRSFFVCSTASKDKDKEGLVSTSEPPYNRLYQPD